EAAGHRRGPGEERFHRRLDAGPDPRRAGDRERAGAPAELAVQDEERQPAQVVPMEGAQDDRVDRSGIEPGALRGDQRRGAAVEEERAPGAGEVEAGLEAAAAPEGVARAEEAEGERGYQQASKRAAAPCPPPTHIVTTP